MTTRERPGLDLGQPILQGIRMQSLAVCLAFAPQYPSGTSDEVAASKLALMVASSRAP